MKKILLTGANGMLGVKIIKILIKTTDYDILAIASSEDKLKVKLEQEEIAEKDRIIFLSNEDFLSNDNSISEIYGAVHLAFSRRTRSEKDIAASIDYSLSIFDRLLSMDVKHVINVSTQGIYGSIKEMRCEDMSPAPDNHYTMAKYATEVMFNRCFSSSNVEEHTNVRLDIVAQNSNLIKVLCNQALNGTIYLRGGEQIFSFIDARDAADGIVTLLFSKGGWERVYNLGWNRNTYNLIEVADIIASAAIQLGYGAPKIKLEKQNIELWSGMDSSRFMSHTKWKPRYSLYDSVIDVMERNER